MNEFPNAGDHVRIISDSGFEQSAIFDNGLWWLLDDNGNKTMYIYYVPKFWKRNDEW
jgi:hypothetical protein